MVSAVECARKRHREPDLDDDMEGVMESIWLPGSVLAALWYVGLSRFVGRRLT